MNSAILTGVQAVLQYVLGVINAAPDTQLSDLGAESLEMVEIAMALEEEFKIDIPEDIAPTASSTVGDIVTLIEGRQK